MITFLINLLLFLGFTTKSTFLRKLIYLDIQKSLTLDRKPYTLKPSEIRWHYLGICQFLYFRYRGSVYIHNLTELKIACGNWVGVKRDNEFWSDPYEISTRLVLIEKALQILKNERSKKR